MGLFNFKKKEEKKPCCCSSCNEETIKEATNIQNDTKGVLILGSGCKKCNELEANTVEALKQLGMDTTINHVRDFAQIATFGVMTTPAIVFNGKVLSFGKVLKTEEIISLIQKEV